MALIAERQHGVISLSQLVDAGLDSRTVRNRAASGRLHRLHLGVYAVGHTSLTQGGSVDGGRAVGRRWRFVEPSGCGSSSWPSSLGRAADDHSPSPAPIELACEDPPRGSSGRRDHVIEGIVTTTVPRTIFDLASVLDRHGLDQVIREAEIRQLERSPLPARSARALSRPARQRGIDGRCSPSSRSAAGSRSSELEARFARFLDAEGLAAARAQRGDPSRRSFHRPRLPVAEPPADRGARWPRRPRSADPERRDKERDRELLLLGWHVIRVTWRHLHQGRAKLAADLRRLLGSKLR